MNVDGDPLLPTSCELVTSNPVLPTENVQGTKLVQPVTQAYIMPLVKAPSVAGVVTVRLYPADPEPLLM